MNEKIKNFIQENEDLIEDNKWDKVYEKIYNSVYGFLYIGKFSETLLEAGIDPLEYLDYIPRGYLSYSNIKSFTIPYNANIIRERAFFGCAQLSEVIISPFVESIEEDAFGQCVSLEKIIIPDNVLHVGEAAFAHCRLLKEVTIGAGIISISKELFYNCKSLQTINFNGTKSLWNSIIKDIRWHYRVPTKVVHCTDGDVDIRHYE